MRSWKFLRFSIETIRAFAHLLPRSCFLLVDACRSADGCAAYGGAVVSLLRASSPLQTFYCVCERRLFCLSRVRADQSPRPWWSFSDQPGARRGAGSSPHLLPSPLLSFSLLSSADSSLPSLPPSSPVLSPLTRVPSCRPAKKNQRTFSD